MGWATGVRFLAEAEFSFSWPPGPDRLWDPHSLQLLPRLRMTGNVTLTSPYVFMEWCLIKHKATQNYFK
jgi:hypothetical protein